MILVKHVPLLLILIVLGEIHAINQRIDTLNAAGVTIDRVSVEIPYVGHGVFSMALIRLPFAAPTYINGTTTKIAR